MSTKQIFNKRRRRNKNRHGRRALRLETLERRELLAAHGPGFVEPGDPAEARGYTVAQDSAEVVEEYQLVKFDVQNRIERVLSVEESLAILNGAGQQQEAESMPGSWGNGAWQGTPSVGEGGADDDSPGMERRFIFPPDTRSRIPRAELTEYPRSANGRMWFTFPGDSDEHAGSGGMIDEFFFITAGHCVHEGGRSGVWADKVVFSAGQDGDRIFEDGTDFRRSEYQPFGEAVGLDLYSFTGWTHYGNYNWDIALVELDRNLGDHTGWLGYGYNSSWSWYDNPHADVSGYPGDLTPDELDQWHVTGNARSHGITIHELHTDTMDLWPGMSGGPLVYDHDGGLHVHGVASHEHDGIRDRFDYNSFTRITGSKFDWIEDTTDASAPIDLPELVDEDRWFNTDLAHFTPGPVEHGASLTVGAWARNNGTADAGSFDVRFRLSTDQTYDVGDYLIGDATVSSLGAFESAEATGAFTVPSVIPAGAYYLTWAIDVPDRLDEYDLEHNYGVKTSSRITIINSPPRLTGLPDRALDEDGSLSNTIYLPSYAEDYDTEVDDLMFTIASTTDSQCGVSIDGTRHVDIEPTDGWSGTADVTIRVEDPEGNWDEDTFRVTVDRVNDPPEISPLPTQSLIEDGSLDDAFHLWDYVSDDESSDWALTYTVTDASDAWCGVSINTDGWVDINPAPDEFGIGHVFIRVEDPEHSAEARLIVHVTSDNDAPVISGLPDLSLMEDDHLDNAIDLDAYASDVETDDWFLAYSITRNTNPDCGVDIDEDGHHLDIQPTAGWSGTSEVTVRVVDWAGEWDEDTFLVEVQPVDDAPAIQWLEALPDPVVAGQLVMLRAQGMVDLDGPGGDGPDAAITRVDFYRESNGVPGLQADDTLVATDTDGTDGWMAWAATAGLLPSHYTYYAQTTDGAGATGPEGTAAVSTEHRVVSEAEDFGDAPDPTYPTLFHHDGARHLISPDFCLGAYVDVEPNGQAHVRASADDGHGLDDEDGVELPDVLVPGTTASVEVTLTAPGNRLLDAWIDFDGDGSWAESVDQIFSSRLIEPGINHLTFDVPLDAAWDTETYARFRVSSAGGLAFDGRADDGEVEDYQVQIGPLSGARRMEIGEVNRGIAAQDGATGKGFIMYSEESVHTRFASDAPYRNTSNNLIAVVYEGGQWYYDNNGGLHAFMHRPTDVLLAEVDFELDTITSLEGVARDAFGIAEGFAAGDLSFFADRWRGSFNDGEFTVEGTYFVTHSAYDGGRRVSIGAVNNGIAAQDGATGHGFIMYSEESVHTRFASDTPYRNNSDRLIAVKYEDGQWHYDDNGGLHAFEPRSTDVLIAEVDFRGDTISSLEGVTGEEFGIAKGFSDGDLSFFADRWRGSFNDGEFTVEGTYFITHGSYGRHVSIGAVNNGIAAQDGATGRGFIMYGAESVHTRFASDAPYRNNSNNLIAVKYEDGQWYYDNNGGLHAFEPRSTDVLIAEVDFELDTITSLEGVARDAFGIAEGFAAGDLSFFADRWRGSFNDGEFTVEGTYFFTHRSYDGGSRVSIGAVNSGIAAQDAATGRGFIMYSEESVHTRFASDAPYPHNSNHLIAVKYEGGQWYYDNNDGLHAFTRRSTDVLLAEVDFGGDPGGAAITSLEGVTGDEFGIAKGFVSGDLTFEANRFGSADNPGEFTVGGTYFIT